MRRITIIDAVRIVFPESFNCCRRIFVRVYLTFDSMNFYSRSSDYEINFMPVLVSPVIYISESNMQHVKYEVLPQDSAIGLPDFIPASCVADESSIKCIYFGAFYDLLFPPPENGWIIEMACATVIDSI